MATRCQDILITTSDAVSSETAGSVFEVAPRPPSRLPHRGIPPDSSRSGLIYPHPKYSTPLASPPFHFVPFRHFYRISLPQLSLLFSLYLPSSLSTLAFFQRKWKSFVFFYFNYSMFFYTI